MNKKTKGALAAAAGAAILVGGAGTMAAWNDSTALDAGTVSAGELNIEERGDGTWTWGGGGAFDPVTQKLVPGDVVIYTATYDITAEGTNLKATLTPSLTGVTGELAPLLVVQTSGDSSDPITSSGTKTISTTVTFDADATTGQRAEADLSGGSVVLQQTLN